tara:strand:+ start:542 stop:1174 length:633 start_codon:yes stop_codon:yes gene_type:complete
MVGIKWEKIIRKGKAMLSNTSKMPGKSISLSAWKCKTGDKLAKIKGSVCHDCYARKGRYNMPNVTDKMEERLKFFNAIDFVPRMVAMLNKTRSPYFRWFDSGDVQNVRMALNIIDIVKATPEKKHWIPTKERKIWLEALKLEALPDNAVIRYSATMVDDTPPEDWEHSSAVVKNAAPIGHECPAPTQGGKCGECRACWSRDVKTVSYHKH